jgi:hypothetical protein
MSMSVSEIFINRVYEYNIQLLEIARLLTHGFEFHDYILELNSLKTTANLGTLQS